MVMAHIVMAYILMAYIVMAYIVMAYIVMAFIVAGLVSITCVCTRGFVNARVRARTRRASGILGIDFSRCLAYARLLASAALTKSRLRCGSTEWRFQKASRDSVSL